MTDTLEVLRKLIDLGSSLDPVAMAVCHPCSEVARRGAVEAARAKLIGPNLVGPAGKIGVDDKGNILQNAIDLAHALDIALSRGAILSAVETVELKIRSTIEAAAPCKMAERGQITGAIVDGPLAFDTAINPEAARIKGLVSDVAGVADILLVPDLESGNMLAKQIEYLAGAKAAGIVLRTRIPIILTSRADNSETRLASCAVAVKLVHAMRKSKLEVVDG
jgi:phosphate acetyltransferase